MCKFNEDEIIKNIKEQIQWSDHNTYRMALQGLLDLYQKEKEKNKKLETELEINKEHQKLNEELRKEIENLQNDNMEKDLMIDGLREERRFGV